MMMVASEVFYVLLVLWAAVSLRNFAPGRRWPGVEHVDWSNGQLVQGGRPVSRSTEILWRESGFFEQYFPAWALRDRCVDDPSRLMYDTERANLERAMDVHHLGIVTGHRRFYRLVLAFWVGAVWMGALLCSEVTVGAVATVSLWSFHQHMQQGGAIDRVISNTRLLVREIYTNRVVASLDRAQEWEWTP